MTPETPGAPEQAATSGDALEITYVGPNGAVHPELGLLVTGQRYTVLAETAKAWTANTPEHWQPGGATLDTDAAPSKPHRPRARATFATESTSATEQE